jgi:hypothetical protein
MRCNTVTGQIDIMGGTGLTMIMRWLLCVHRVGLDLYEGTVRDNRKAGVLEPAISKIKSLKFATEAAITILRIDDMIRLDPERKDKSYRDAYD